MGKTEILGKRIRKIRKEMNKTQEEMAIELGTTKATISRYESNVHKPDPDFINKIADYFNVSADYLLGRTNIRNSQWLNDLPDEIQEFVRKENIEYLNVIKQAKEDGWSPGAIKELINVIKTVK